jgi:serine phosphatase RsbU (regulator of sigma subunit)
MISTSLLRHVPIFAKLPEHELELLAQALSPAEFMIGDALCYEGEPGDSFMVITQGEVEVIKALGTPDQHTFGTRSVGGFIGEISLFDPQGKRSASVLAITPVQVYTLMHSDFDALLHRQPGLAYEMLRQISLRVQNDDDTTIRDLQEKNRQLAQAYQELKAAQAQLVEKEKLEHELQLARNIQESILPRNLPILPGYDIGALMRPARAVGGDFYDVFVLSPGRLGVAIADVSDKGIPAAIFMALTRSLLRGLAQPNARPAKTLQEVNQLLLGMNDAGMFVTVLYGILDGPARTFEYARAGHELPYLTSAEGIPLAVPHTVGQPLALIPSPKLDEQRLELPLGSTLLLTTDGATDAMSPSDESFGAERLRQVTCGSFPSAQAVCDGIMEALDAYRQDSPQFDDITLVDIRTLDPTIQPI